MTRTHRPALARLATPQVVSWPLFWASGALVATDDLRQVWSRTSTIDVGIAEVPAALAGTLLGHVTAFALLLIARVSWLRSRWSQRHPMVTVNTFFVVSAVAQIGVTLSPIDSPTTGFERTLVQTSALVVMALIVSAVREHRQIIGELSTTQSALVESLREGTTRMERQRRDITSAVDAVLDSTMTALRSPTAALPAVLHQASEDALRPLSHTIAATSNVFTPRAVQVPNPRWRVVLARVATQPLIAPLPIAATMTVMASRLTIVSATSVDPEVSVDLGTNTVGATADWGSFFRSLAELAAVFALTYATAWLVRRFTPAALTSLSTGMRWTLISLSLIPIAMAAEVGNAFVISASPRPVDAFTPWALLSSLIPVLVVTLIVAIVRAVASAGQDIRGQIAAANDELTWQVARINNQLWAERRDLSLAVHGPIRAVLIAGAIELEQAAAAGISAGERTAIAERTAERLVAARAALTEPVAVPDVMAMLDDVQRLWRGICQIETAVTPQTQARLTADPDAAAAVIAVVGEAIGNAINHAHAQRVAIGIDCEERLVVLTVANDGDAPTGAGTTGLGTALLNDLTTSWSLMREGDHTTLRVQIPLA